MVISFLRALAILGRTFPLECRVLEPAEILGGVLCPRHTDEEAESSMFIFFKLHKKGLFIYF